MRALRCRRRDGFGARRVPLRSLAAPLLRRGPVAVAPLLRRCSETVQETARVVRPTSRVRRCPGEVQFATSAGHSDMEKTFLLRELFIALGIHRRHGSVGHAHHENDVPLEALRLMQGCQGHPRGTGAVSTDSERVDLGQQRRGGRRRCPRQCLNKLDEGLLGLPARPSSAETTRRFVAAEPGTVQEGRKQLQAISLGFGPSCPPEGHQYRPHFFAIEERRVLGDDDSDISAGKRGLETGLGGVEAVQDRYLRRRCPRSDGSPGGTCHPGSLTLLVVKLADFGLGGGGSGGDKWLCLASYRHPVGPIQDLRAGAVVTCEVEHLSVGVAPREPGQVYRVRPLERINGLPRVADDTDVAAVTQYGVEEALLGRVGVLVLVHRHMCPTVPYRPSDQFFALDQSRRDLQQVGKIDLADPGFCRVEPLPAADHRRGVDAGTSTSQHRRPRVILDAEELAACPADFVHDVTQFGVVGLLTEGRSERVSPQAPLLVVWQNDW